MVPAKARFSKLCASLWVSNERICDMFAHGKYALRRASIVAGGVAKSLTCHSTHSHLCHPKRQMVCAESLSFGCQATIQHNKLHARRSCRKLGIAGFSSTQGGAIHATVAHSTNSQCSVPIRSSSQEAMRQYARETLGLDIDPPMFWIRQSQVQSLFTKKSSLKQRLECASGVASFDTAVRVVRRQWQDRRPLRVFWGTEDAQPFVTQTPRQPRSSIRSQKPRDTSQLLSRHWKPRLRKVRTCCESKNTLKAWLRASSRLNQLQLSILPQWELKVRSCTSDLQCSRATCACDVVVWLISVSHALEKITTKCHKSQSSLLDSHARIQEQCKGCEAEVSIQTQRHLALKKARSETTRAKLCLELVRCSKQHSLVCCKHFYAHQSNARAHAQEMQQAQQQSKAQQCTASAISSLEAKHNVRKQLNRCTGKNRDGHVVVFSGSTEGD